MTECLELLLPPAIHRDRRQSSAGIELEQMSISDVSEEEKEETCSQLTDSPEYEPPSDLSTTKKQKSCKFRLSTNFVSFKSLFVSRQLTLSSLLYLSYRTPFFYV